MNDIKMLIIGLLVGFFFALFVAASAVEHWTKIQKSDNGWFVEDAGKIFRLVEVK